MRFAYENLAPWLTKIFPLAMPQFLDANVCFASLMQMYKFFMNCAKNRIIFEKDKRYIQSLGEQLNNISNKLFLQVSQTIQPTQEALLQASVVANLLKQGGYPFNLRIVQRDDGQNDFIQIVIFPTTREEL